MEIVVDAYGPEEQALSWYYYLESALGFPFRARATPQARLLPSHRHHDRGNDCCDNCRCQRHKHNLSGPSVNKRL